MRIQYSGNVEPFTMPPPLVFVPYRGNLKIESRSLHPRLSVLQCLLGNHCRWDADVSSGALRFLATPPSLEALEKVHLHPSLSERAGFFLRGLLPYDPSVLFFKDAEALMQGVVNFWGLRTPLSVLLEINFDRGGRPQTVSVDRAGIAVLRYLGILPLSGWMKKEFEKFGLNLEETCPHPLFTSRFSSEIGFGLKAGYDLLVAGCLGSTTMADLTDAYVSLGGATFTGWPTGWPGGGFALGG